MTHSDNEYYFDRSFDSLRSSISEDDLKRFKPTGSSSSKLFNVEDLNANISFDYGALHDEWKQLLITCAQNNSNIEYLKNSLGEFPLVKMAVIGGLDEGAISHFYDSFEIEIDRVLSKEECHKYFSKVILGINLPALRPTVYLKVRESYRKKRKVGTYLKIGPCSLRQFRYEKNIPMYALYFQSLERSADDVGVLSLDTLMKYFLRDEVAVAKRRYKPPNLIIADTNTRYDPPLPD